MHKKRRAFSKRESVLPQIIEYEIQFYDTKRRLILQGTGVPMAP
nr:MAG TPA: hypothetical protein [Caudoviricetes sp.]